MNKYQNRFARPFIKKKFQTLLNDFKEDLRKESYYCKLVNSNLIYRFNEISIKMPILFFLRNLVTLQEITRA